jgi:hypothetical protein
MRVLGPDSAQKKNKVKFFYNNLAFSEGEKKRGLSLQKNRGNRKRRNFFLGNKEIFLRSL